MPYLQVSPGRPIGKSTTMETNSLRRTSLILGKRFDKIKPQELAMRLIQRLPPHQAWVQFQKRKRFRYQVLAKYKALATRLFQRLPPHPPI